MGRRARNWLWALLLLPAVTGPAVWSAARAEASPTLQLSVAAADPGDQIVVRIEGLDGAVATLATCGNAGRRGSPDCDLLGAQSVKIEPSQPTLMDFTVTRPPVDCPCVVRAATASDRQVVTAPIAVEGVPDGGPIVDPASVTRASLHVDAKVATRPRGFPASWASAFAGSAARLLVVTVDNRGDETRDVRVSAVVGRNRSSGEPLASRHTAVPGHTRRQITVPFDLPAPAFGDYVVYGDVSSGNDGITFSAAADNDPWALELLIPIALLVLAQCIRWRTRAARSRARVPADAAPDESFGESSPEVGAGAEERSPSPTYDPVGAPATAVPASLVQ
jgi:hypothetical protein